MPATMKESKAKKFKKPEFMFIIKCDVHPWMKTYAAVMEHPFFAVTAADGKFKIAHADLKDGDYEIEAWHEKVGVRKGKATIKGGKATLDFTFSR